MRAMVTGGAGFIGSALVDSLVADGVPTATVDALTYAGSISNLAGAMGSAHHIFAETDVRDQQAVETLLETHKPNVVFHLAAETHVDRSIDAPRQALETNIEGTYAMLAAATSYWSGLEDAARAAFRFVQVSSDEVFGSAADGLLFRETSRYNPNSPYAASKASADYLVRTWSMTFGLPVLVAHGCNTYGPRQFPEKLVPLMILNGTEGNHLPIYGSGTQVRDWMHVDDHVRGLRAVASRGALGESYLLSACNPLMNIELVDRLCATLDGARPDGAPHAALISHVDDRPGHDARYAADPSKAEHDLGWRAEVDFEEGLADTVRWYLANGDWCAQVQERYQRERLGLARAAQ
ncbi:MAG: dTDP-glucose 4,6-dehydratase [Rhodospirillaceae bacterium]|nr:dTDP-glucose 4,6-dehydratase [Rhodospirillaceae bacterium]MBT4773704.1 dTDP-glucose 4,6-dehydratase [Rhodospirillaceae bacterium]MBT5357640.1 dTDP-glucose 4,6-dehydratase [Rhodospirillaceae bacterium]MBT5770629.1 dTDP-glucose 4,6-dehydratase [Rhodospirillaceae bacterium]MBT6308600.1 dTDP-glucose 4,6-dehydratase [Rhodospirillaceae bacterium]